MSDTALPSASTFVANLLASIPTSHQPPSTNTTRFASLPEPERKKIRTLHVLFPNEFLPALDLLDRRLVTRFRIRQEAKDERVATTTMPRVAGQESGEAGNRITARDGGAEIHAPEGVSAPGGGTVAGGCDAGSIDVDLQDRLSHGNMREDVKGDLGLEDGGENTVYYVRSAQQRTSKYSTSYDATTSYEVRLTAWNCSCPAFAFAAFPSVLSEPDMSTVAGNEDEEEDIWRFGGVSLGKGLAPVCKHLLACVLAERCDMYKDFVEERVVSVEEAAGWAAGWGD